MSQGKPLVPSPASPVDPSCADQNATINLANGQCRPTKWNRNTSSNRSKPPVRKDGSHVNSSIPINDNPIPRYDNPVPRCDNRSSLFRTASRTKVPETEAYCHRLFQDKLLILRAYWRFCSIEETTRSSFDSFRRNRELLRDRFASDCVIRHKHPLSVFMASRRPANLTTLLIDLSIRCRPSADLPAQAVDPERSAQRAVATSVMQTSEIAVGRRSGIGPVPAVLRGSSRIGEAATRRVPI